MTNVGRWSLSRIPGFRHASDDALVFLALVGPDASPARLIDHVSICSRCALRLGAVERALAEDRRQLMAGDDQEFSPARLERQRASVLKRIGGSRAAARILPFPEHGPVATRPRHPMMRRSVAAAAVGGLLIGGVAGRLLDAGRQPGRPAPVADSVSLGSTSEAGATIRAAAFSEETFLGEFEAAIGAPRIEPLRALDALTPRPADVTIVR